MRKALALGATAASFAALAITGAPAMAADGTTTTTFTVVDGSLAIVTTAAATGVNTVLSGTSKVADISLGVTTINDTRSNSTGWSYSAKTTDFASTTSTATVPKTSAAFSIPSAPTSTLGSPTFPTRVSTPTTVDSTGSSGVLLKADATGVNDATFTPYLRVSVSSATPLEIFTGTVTQSVV